MKFLKIKHSSLFYRGRSETSYKQIHMHNLSFFASGWKNSERQAFRLRPAPLQHFVMTNRKLDGDTTPAFPFVSYYWAKGLVSTCFQGDAHRSCQEAADRSTATPWGATDSPQAPRQPGQRPQPSPAPSGTQRCEAPGSPSRRPMSPLSQTPS